MQCVVWFCHQTSSNYEQLALIESAEQTRSDYTAQSRRREILSVSDKNLNLGVTLGGKRWTLLSGTIFKRQDQIQD